MTLSACARSLDSLPAPLAVSVPEICEQILEPVPLPPARVGDDAELAFMAGDAALLEANDRIVAGRECVRDQRREYAGKGGPT